MATNEVIDIAIGLLEKDGQLLITKRHAEAHLGSLWEFPGGKVEPGETPREAVAREMLEEVGLSVRVGTLLHEEIAHYPGRSVRLLFFCCTTHGERDLAKPLAAAQLAWVYPQELTQYDFPKGNDALLAKLARIQK